MSSRLVYVMWPMEIVTGRLVRPRGNAASSPTAPSWTPRGRSRTFCDRRCNGRRAASRSRVVVTRRWCWRSRRTSPGATGFPEPVAVTRVFPRASSEADEHEWQERRSIRHLGVRRLAADHHPRRARHRRARSPPVTCASTASCGHRRSPPMPRGRRRAGGSLLDGEGGDEVLGSPATASRRSPACSAPRPLRQPPVRCRRATRVLHRPATHAPGVGRGSPMGPVTVAAPRGREPLLAALGPPTERQRRCRSRERPAGARRRTQVLGQPQPQDPRRASRRGAVEPAAAPRRRPGARPRGRRARPGDRTDVLRALVPDLLPDVVISRGRARRRSPAATWAITRAIRGWVDAVRASTPSSIDADELRRGLAGRHPSPLRPTAALLQPAWLASNGSGAAGGNTEVASTMLRACNCRLMT